MVTYTCNHFNQQMLQLNHDMWLLICKDFTTCEKIALASINKLMESLKHKFEYYDDVNAHTICNLSYRHNFKYVFQLAETTHIPDYVTHVYFHDALDQPIEGRIPKSVIQIVFGRSFSHPLLIPETVKHVIISRIYEKATKPIGPNYHYF